ncbi:MAG TPA: protein kinase [Gemmatimonadaceae bacterium]|nr:protein kinase [Gemmatimonadaceae bacterium]
MTHDVHSALPSTAPASLGPYRLLELLGSGGMGRVYLAELIEDRPFAPRGARVALKLLHPILLGHETSERRFALEAEIGARVRHPCVVRTYESGVADAGGGRSHYLALEYVEGTTLRRLVDELGTLPEALLRAIGAQAARGLSAIHAAGVVHRDLKPENVLITPDHQVKVMDLGIAQLAEQATRLTRTGMFVGTFTYSAPEYLSGRGVGPASDLYSLGVVLYEAAAGTQPFAAGDFATVMWRHLQHVPPRLGAVDPRFTPLFEETVARLLEKDPARRFASADELATVLEEGERSAWWRTDGEALCRASPRVERGRIPVARDTPFVGRAEAMTLLRRSQQETAARLGGRVVLLEGETGIGKSRLVDEFIRALRAEQQDVVVLYGAFSPGAGGLEGLVQAVVDHLGTAALDGRLAALLPTPIVPGADAASRVSAGPSRVERPSDETVHGVFLEVVQSLSEHHPLVWVVDDLHFASADGQRLVLALARQLRRQPFLLVVTARPDPGRDPLEHLARLEGARRLRLERLGVDDVVRIVAARTGRQSVAEDVGAVIAERTDGNPLFVVEFLKELEETGRLHGLVESAAAVRRELGHATTPASVRELMLARLRGLPDRERELLDVAAVQGFEFDPDLIARVSGAQRLAVLQSLAALERRAGLVRAEGAGFRFDHHQLREVLYESMPPLLRTEYHAALADAFLARHGTAGQPADGVAGPEALFLAEHSLRGGRTAQGLAYTIAALDHLAEQYGRDQQAVELADLALAAIGRDDAARRCDLQLRRAEALGRLLRRADELAAAHDALAAAAALGDARRHAQASLALGRNLTATGAYDEAWRVLEAALPLASAVGDRRTERDVTGSLARLHHVAGRFHAAQAGYHREIALARTLGDRRGECRALDNLGNTFLALNAHPEAEECLRTEIAIAREHGIAESEMAASFGLGVIAMWRGDYGDAHAHLQRQLVLSRGFPMRSTLGRAALAQLCYETGQLDEAEQHIAIGSERAEIGQQRHVLTFLRLYAADVARARGHAADAQALYREAVATARSLGARQAIAATALGLGRLLLELGAAEEARPCLQEAAALVRELHLAAPGPLPAAYLALLGDASPDSLTDGPSGACAIWAELHLVLHRAGAGEAHLDRAGALLERMSRHLHGAEAHAFWSHYPNARTYRAALARRAVGAPAAPP